MRAGNHPNGVLNFESVSPGSSPGEQIGQREREREIYSRNWLIWCIDGDLSSLIQLCPTLCHPMDYSLPGSSVHEIIPAIILEWVAISSSRRSS